MYLPRAVGTDFEIATFPLATILHSRYIEKNFFSVFENFAKKEKKLKKKHLKND